MLSILKINLSGLRLLLSRLLRRDSCYSESRSLYSRTRTVDTISTAHGSKYWTQISLMMTPSHFRFLFVFASICSLLVPVAAVMMNPGDGADSQCLRGTICVEGACKEVSCSAQGIFDCPEAPAGSVGRTCLQDELVCSEKECGEGRPECPMGKTHRNGQLSVVV